VTLIKIVVNGYDRLDVHAGHVSTLIALYIADPVDWIGLRIVPCRPHMVDTRTQNTEESLQYVYDRVGIARKAHVRPAG